MSNKPADRPARPAPRPALANDCVAPRDAREATLGKVWEAVLGVAPIGVDDDFFDLGGDSLRAFALVAAVTRTFGVPLKTRDLFDGPTIAAMAVLIGQRGRTG
jgi:acyl carrier protein